MKLQHEREMYFMKINSSNNIATTITSTEAPVHRVLRSRDIFSFVRLVFCLFARSHSLLLARSLCVCAVSGVSGTFSSHSRLFDLYAHTNPHPHSSRSP